MSKQENLSTAKFYTASAAVYAALEDIQAGEERFNQFLKWCLDGISELEFDVLHNIHVGEFEMKPWKQISFPDNMVDWTKIGFRTGDSIKVFTQDGSIPKLFDKIDCVPQENSPDIGDLPTLDVYVPFYGADDYFRGGDHYYGALVGTNFSGYFDVDKRSRVINFKRVVSGVSKIYMEYITDGINPTGQTVIHPYAFKALQYYIHWQRKLHDDRYGIFERQEAQKLWEKEVDKVLVRNMDLSIEDIKEALRSGYSQVPKS